MLYIETLIIAVFWVVVIDTTDFYDRVTGGIRAALTGGKFRKPFYVKPFCCSLCMTWWSGVVYLLLTHSVSLLALGYVLGLSFFTPTLKDVLLLVRDLLAKAVNEIYRRLGL